jgi:hypothetical protein
MLRLHSAVQQQQQRFARPPLGPLGALLSVADQRWAGAIDAALKYTLEAWVVHSRADQKLLMVRQRERAARGKRWEWHCPGPLGALPTCQKQKRASIRGTAVKCVLGRTSHARLCHSAAAHGARLLKACTTAVHLHGPIQLATPQRGR